MESDRNRLQLVLTLARVAKAREPETNSQMMEMSSRGNLGDGYRRANVSRVNASTSLLFRHTSSFSPACSSTDVTSSFTASSVVGRSQDPFLHRTPSE